MFWGVNWGMDWHVSGVDGGTMSPVTAVQMLDVRRSLCLKTESTRACDRGLLLLDACASIDTKASSVHGIVTRAT